MSVPRYRHLPPPGPPATTQPLNPTLPTRDPSPGVAHYACETCGWRGSTPSQTLPPRCNRCWYPYLVWTKP